MSKENEKGDRRAPRPLPEIGSPERLLAEKKLVRKLDSRLLPTIRNGITTARLKGYNRIWGSRRVLSILFASYCPAQIPSNGTQPRRSTPLMFPQILNRITRYHQCSPSLLLTTNCLRPSWYIGLCVMGWGLTRAEIYTPILTTEVTKNYGGILACRVFIGLPEVRGIYPGAIYLLSRWYTKKELAFRSAILYVGLLISNAFGALIAAGILANGRLFFIEMGAPGLCLNLPVTHLCIHLLFRQPNNTRWILGDERRLAQARLADDAGEADQDNENDTPLAGLRMAITDPLILVFAIMNAAQLLGLSFINFFPTLTQTLGFSTTISLLLAAPPWVVASTVTCLSAWHADKTGERYFHVAGPWWGVILGFIISLATMNTGARYLSMILMACGYAGFSLTIVWVSNVIPRPPSKRAAAIGIVNGVGNLGNLMGSYTWKAAWGPQYHQSMLISLCALVLSSVMSLGIRQHLIRRNRKLDEDERLSLQGADEIRVKEAALLEGITFEQAMERRKGFRYLY
ncbi:major facilitator superfamily domain-containing protein [Mycena metata]|uniref:Major facilitator superfamily domain-containing protein n=1 Tax=Mycena metata TaxID=1033252 RepID=A0AAD7MIW7_9AGAR|nr:major facilitator superfamily domain-containing protein [Mycena metata]